MEPYRYGPPQPLVLNEFSARSLREQPTRDTINAREYVRWNNDEKYPANGDPMNFRITGERATLPFYDMAPTSSRLQDRTQFQQAQPFLVDAPPFQDNPYFAKYDVTSDPRNITRELRAAVTENDADKGVNESVRLFSRGFDARNIPVASNTSQVEKALEDYNFLRPRMDDMKTNYRR